MVTQHFQKQQKTGHDKVKWSDQSVAMMQRNTARYTIHYKSVSHLTVYFPKNILQCTKLFCPQSSRTNRGYRPFVLQGETA
jgi:hypothetical protein